MKPLDTERASRLNGEPKYYVSRHRSASLVRLFPPRRIGLFPRSKDAREQHERTLTQIADAKELECGKYREHKSVYSPPELDSASRVLTLSLLIQLMATQVETA